jgi:hypothetical protein
MNIQRIAGRIVADEFQQMANKFLEWAQKVVDQSMSDYPTQDKELSLMRGKRYWRVVDTIKYNGQNSGQSSAWAFLDSTNGDILKPASWKKPAKHARANLYDQSTWAKNVDGYGPKYLR